MIWLTCVVIIMIISGFLDIIEKKGSADQPKRFWVLLLFFYGLFNIIVGLITGFSIITEFSFQHLLYVFPVTLLTTIGCFCTVNAFLRSDISKVSPILRSKIIWILILTCVFVGNPLSFFQTFLIFAILILLILLSYKKNNTKSNSGVIYAFGFLFANGTGLFIESIVVQIINNTSYVSFYSGINQLTILFTILIISKNLSLLNFKKFNNLKFVIGMELLEVIAIYLNRYALLHGNVVIITSMTSCSLIIAILLSKIFFKEKIKPIKMAIILLITICLITLSIISI